MLTHDTVNSKYSANAGAWYYRGSAVAEMGDRHGPKSGRLLWPFPYVGGSWVPTQNNVAWAEAYLLTKWHLDPSSRLATIDMGRKVGGAVPLSGGDVGLHAPFGGTWVSIKHNVAWAEAYLRTKWHLDPSSRLVTIDMGRKVGGTVPFRRGSWAPSNTVWPGSRPTSVPSGILIHLAVWHHNRHRPKSGDAVPLFGGEIRPHLTQCGLVQGLSSYQVASWSIQRFGHITPMLQADRTGQTGQTGQTDNCPMAFQKSQVERVIKQSTLPIETWCNISVHDGQTDAEPETSHYCSRDRLELSARSRPCRVALLWHRLPTRRLKAYLFSCWTNAPVNFYFARYKCVDYCTLSCVCICSNSAFRE